MVTKTVRDSLLTTDQVAEMVGMRPGTIENWRYKVQGPPYVKINRAVRYRASDVQTWLDSLEAA